MNDEQKKKLIADTDKNMTSILGSYRLSKNTDGTYALKRGNWFVYSVTMSRGGGPAYREWQEYYSGVKNVGVDRDLFLPQYQYLLDKHERLPQHSANIGRWER